MRKVTDVSTTIYQIGNTLKLQAQFKDFDDVLTDPDSVSLIIYNSDYSVEETLTPTKTSIGIYTAYWTIPSGTSGATYIYEWSGTINEYPSLKRELFKVSFV